MNKNIAPTEPVSHGPYNREVEDQPIPDLKTMKAAFNTQFTNIHTTRRGKI